MRKSILFFVFLALSLSPVIAHSDGDHTVEVEFVSLRTVSGTVTLTAKTKGFPSTLSSLYKGREKAVNLTPAGKVIKVSGSYDGTDTVRVNEKGNHEASYSFILPVIRSVIESIANATDKDSDGSGSVRAIFDGIVITAGSLESVVEDTETETDVHIVRDVSVGKITASRKGNRAVVRGSFLKTGSSAKGRFKLVFTE